MNIIHKGVEIMFEFKNFSVKPAMTIDGSEVKNKYAIECSGRKSNFVIAFIEYDKKESNWDFKSVGTRYLEYRSDGLEKYILTVIELLNMIKTYEEE